MTLLYRRIFPAIVIGKDVADHVKVPIPESAFPIIAARSDGGDNGEAGKAVFRRDFDGALDEPFPQPDMLRRAVGLFSDAETLAVDMDFADDRRVR